MGTLTSTSWFATGEIPGLGSKSASLGGGRYSKSFIISCIIATALLALGSLSSCASKFAAVSTTCSKVGRAGVENAAVHV